MSSSTEKPYITCHVLDTVSGKPAAGISVSLELLEPELNTRSGWTARTNSDGRVTAWDGDTEVNNSVEKIRQASTAVNELSMWRLTFETEAYYGKGNTFWPQVKLEFSAKMSEEHYHVPLLLGPWSYTTYRGS